MHSAGRTIAPLALALVMILVVGSPASADQPSFRDQCRSVGSTGPRPVDPFTALTRSYIMATFSEAVADDPPGHEASGPEIARGALLIMVTNSGRVAKLLMSVDGQGLLIHKLVTYDARGTPMPHAARIRLTENATLDVDRGKVNAPEADADFRWERSGASRAVRPLNGVKLRTLVAVPVVGHFMKSRDEFYRRNNVEERFSPSALGTLLAAAGTLNTIWRPAGVFFFLHRVEHCSYLIQDLHPGAPAQAFENVPYPADDCLALFNRINRGYNFPTTPSMDVYVWWSIEVTGVVGYAAPHKVMGDTRQNGAVWLDKACADPTVNPLGDCGHALAHEAGHFLGLCHTCLTPATPPASRGQCGICLNIRDCGTNDRGPLMRDDAAGRELPAGEIGLARAKALERFQGSVRPRPN